VYCVELVKMNVKRHRFVGVANRTCFETGCIVSRVNKLLEWCLSDCLCSRKQRSIII